MNAAGGPETLRSSSDGGRKRSAWLSVHAYRHPVTRDFILDTVADAVEALSATGRLEGFFFIRYVDDGGPHVRLRVRGRRPWLEGRTRQILEERFRRYFRRRPSDPWSPAPEAEPEKLDRLAFRPYVPEVERYGGPRRIGTAEREFEISSRTVLDLLDRWEEWNDDLAMGLATRLNVALAHAFGFGRDEAIEFFDRMCSSWTGVVLGDVEPGRAPAARREMRELFEELYLEQRPRLLAAVGPIWQGLDEESAADLSPWLRRWHRDHRGISRELRASGDPDDPLEQGDLRRIVSSYIHMTNNRLGIRNRDEALLAYLLHRSLHEAASADVRSTEPGR